MFEFNANFKLTRPTHRAKEMASAIGEVFSKLEPMKEVLIAVLSSMMSSSSVSGRVDLTDPRQGFDGWDDDGRIDPDYRSVIAPYGIGQWSYDELGNLSIAATNDKGDVLRIVVPKTDIQFSVIEVVCAGLLRLGIEIPSFQHERNDDEPVIN